MKAITFLGAGRAYDTAYCLEDGREHTAQFFGVALARFYPDLSMRVFVTPEAKALHYDAFLKQVEDFVANIEPVHIPNGENEAQLWTIFEQVVDTVEDREDVIFDITHGFRSLPFLSFLAASYLRVIKQINLEAVLYGNFEARDQSVSPHRAPVIDLTPFVSLLDWMVAADRFVRFGDAQDLARQLRAAAPSSQELRTDPTARRISKELLGAADVFDEISKSLRLIRPLDAIQASAKLEASLLNASGAMQSNARPFLPLSRQVISAYAGISLPSAQVEIDPVTTLHRERTLVHWYMERKQYVQAVAVAREWIVSWTLFAVQPNESLLDRNQRYLIERSLGHLGLEKRKGVILTQYDPPTIESTVTALRHLPEVDAVVKRYDAVGQIRNDLLHAGKNDQAATASKLENKIRKVGQWLDELPLPDMEVTPQ